MGELARGSKNQLVLAGESPSADSGEQVLETM